MRSAFSNTPTFCGGTRSGPSRRSSPLVCSIASLVCGLCVIVIAQTFIPIPRRRHSDGTARTVPIWTRGALVQHEAFPCLHDRRYCAGTLRDHLFAHFTGANRPCSRRSSTSLSCTLTKCPLPDRMATMSTNTSFLPSWSFPPS